MTTEGIQALNPDGTVVTTAANTGTPDGNPELRAALDNEKDKNKTLRGELMSVRLDAIGLTPESGLGKAIAKEYDGDMTVEAVSAFALDEYGHEGSVETVPSEVVTSEKLEQLNSVSESVTPPPPVDPLAESEEAMNQPEAGRDEAIRDMNLKAGAFYQEHYGTEQT